MTVDIRATVTCSLGTLISASISDDYIQGTGLIKCKGSCEINDLITPAPGSVVTFRYTKDGVTRTIPRKLRVLSSFADPFRRTTKVELGCKLTYLQDLKDPIEWSTLDDPENSNITEEEAEIITFPITAASTAIYCLSKLGISGSVSLDNKFSVAKFDYSPGYVQVLSDLLVSESKCGYLDAGEIFTVINLNVQGGSGPRIDSSKIIDVSPIGVGQLAGDAVTVSYSTLKLKVTGEVEIDEDGNLVDSDGFLISTSSWPSAESSASSDIAISYTDINGNQQVRTYKVLTTTKETTQFREIGGRNVTTRRKVEETTTSVAVAGGIASEYLSAGLNFGTGTVSATTVEQFDYDSRGYEVRRVLTKYGDALYAAGSLGVPFVINGEAVSVPSGQVLLQEEITNTYRSRSFTKTVTDRYGTWLQSIQGQQAIAAGYDTFTTASEVNAYIEQALNGRYLIETDISIVKGDTTQEGPSQEEINNANTADPDGDPTIDYRVEETAGLQLAIGSPTAERRIELSMPYASDDIFIKGAQIPGTNPPRYYYSSLESDASTKAVGFGRTQNRLLFGNRNGMNIQTVPERVPSAPFAPLTVYANGLSALYRMNGTSWTMDSNGIVLSSDLLFWGAVGGTGLLWFPVAPGINTLPTTPPVTDTAPTQVIGTETSLGADPATYLATNYPTAISGDGVFDEETNDFWVYDGANWNNVGPTPGPTTTVTTVVPPWNETVLTAPRVRVKLEASSLAYALAIQTNTTPYGIVIASRPGRLLAVPVADVQLAGYAPAVTGGASVAIPVTTFTFAVLQPGTLSGVSVAVPEAAILINEDPALAFLPYVGQYVKLIQVPKAAQTLTPLAPNIITGLRIEVPAANTSVAALAPLVNDIPVPTVVSFTSQYGSIGSYRDVLRPYQKDDILLYFCEISGADTMPSVPVEDSLFRPTSDAMGTWQLIPGAPVTDVATTAGSKLYVWWMRANFDTNDYDETVVPDSGDHQYGRCLIIRGCRTVGVPYDVIATDTKTTASTSSSAPAVTTTVKNALVVSCISRPNDSSSTSSFTIANNSTLTDVTKRGEMGTSLGNGGGFVVITGVKATPGGTGVTTINSSVSVTNASITIALRG